MKFTETMRERFLTRLEMGESIDAACVAAGVSRSTVERLRAKGRTPGADAGAAEFARRLDAVQRQARSAPKSGGEDAPPLTDDDLKRVLERSARGGSAESARALLSRRGREVEEEPVEPLHFGDVGYVDAMTWLAPEDMALLNEEQKQRAREVYVAEVDAIRTRTNDPRQTAEEWQAERALILSGKWDVEPADPPGYRAADDE